MHSGTNGERAAVPAYAAATVGVYRSHSPALNTWRWEVTPRMKPVVAYTTGADMTAKVTQKCGTASIVFASLRSLRTGLHAWS